MQTVRPMGRVILDEEDAKRIAAKYGIPVDAVRERIAKGIPPGVAANHQRIRDHQKAFEKQRPHGHRNLRVL